MKDAKARRRVSTLESRADALARRTTNLEGKISKLEHQLLETRAALVGRTAPGIRDGLTLHFPETVVPPKPEFPGMVAFWSNVWEKGGCMRCRHCGGPIYTDRSSGYWMHMPRSGDTMPDGKNGYYCSSIMWADGVAKKTAAPAT